MRAGTSASTRTRMVACEMAGTKMQEPLPTPQKVGLHLKMHLQMWAGTRAWGPGVAVVKKRDGASGTGNAYRTKAA